MLLPCIGACPVWTIYNSSSGECKCGDDLGGVVHCDSESYSISLLKSYCMSYNAHYNSTIVGRCNIFYMNKYYGSYNMLNVGDDALKVNIDFCRHYRREGQLCGRCIKGYAPPVYSYSMKCVECPESAFKSNLLKYVAVAFLPITAFYLGAIVFKLSVTSGSMVAYVLVCQLVSVPTLQRFLMRHEKINYSLLLTGYSLWNLDFFRSLYKPFCIHPRMTTLHVLALDYLVGVYPLFLIFLTYIAVKLHDHYPIALKLQRLLKCTRKEWSVRGSLIQAFATFLVLSYVKILDVSFDLLTPVYLNTVDGGTLNQTYVYNAGDLVYFGSEHLPFGILAVFMLTVFNVLPMVLLFLYPYGWFRECLRCCRANSNVLHTFMDAFQGCYRHQPRDCRFFAALYLLFRTLNIVSFALFSYEASIALSCFVFIIATMFVSCAAPYREEAYNKVDALFFLLIASSFPVSYLGHYAYVGQYKWIFKTILEVASMTPLFYGFALFLRKVLPKKLQLSLRGYCGKLTTCRWRSAEQNTENDEPPYRFETENAPLLHKQYSHQNHPT